jgi:serine/threonine-protein kinase haspin
MKPKKWHNKSSRNSNNGHSWKEFIPYTNVLWIKYLLGYVKENFKKNSGDAGELSMFEKETKDLSSRLDYRSSVRKGAFSTALEVYQYVIQEGWITKEQVEEMSGVTKETEE